HPLSVSNRTSIPVTAVVTPPDLVRSRSQPQFLSVAQARGKERLLRAVMPEPPYLLTLRFHLVRDIACIPNRGVEVIIGHQDRTPPMTAAGGQKPLLQDRDHLVGRAITIGVTPTMNRTRLREPQPIAMPAHPVHR